MRLLVVFLCIVIMTYTIVCLQPEDNLPPHIAPARIPLPSSSRGNFQVYSLHGGRGAVQPKTIFPYNLQFCVAGRDDNRANFYASNL